MLLLELRKNFILYQIIMEYNYIHKTYFEVSGKMHLSVFSDFKQDISLKYLLLNFH